LTSSCAFPKASSHHHVNAAEDCTLIMRTCSFKIRAAHSHAPPAARVTLCCARISHLPARSPHCAPVWRRSTQQGPKSAASAGAFIRRTMSSRPARSRTLAGPRHSQPTDTTSQLLPLDQAPRQLAWRTQSSVQDQRQHHRQHQRQHHIQQHHKERKQQWLRIISTGARTCSRAAAYTQAPPQRVLQRHNAAQRLC